MKGAFPPSFPITLSCNNRLEDRITKSSFIQATSLFDFHEQMHTKRQQQVNTEEREYTDKYLTFKQ